MRQKNPYLLLTPGPLSTSEGVREVMGRDWCTWDQDYHLIVQDIRNRLLQLSEGGEDYSVVLMQGSGSFVVESVLWSNLKNDSKILVLANGAYGMRMAKMVQCMERNLVLLQSAENQQPDASEVGRLLEAHPDITHIGMVHCETTTGMLNDYVSIARLAENHGKIFILDAMSSFGGIPIDVRKPKIDFLISSANKCIQGVPGFGLVIARKSSLKACKGVSRSHCLDLYDQWETMDTTGGKWRFTSPTHTVRAFLQALNELEAEGGIARRHERFKANHLAIVNGLAESGIRPFLREEDRSPIITAFLEPESRDFDFNRLYLALKAAGFVIYPGKVSEAATFRIGHIGDVFPDDFSRLAQTFKNIRFW
ncbi:MAG: 2-aminoethylphosphonate--pyruvate transaminase [Cyclobacteriaceae bacterium]|nr:2-aminoethylphosphonate--pyruvate transaminase [Cyclobacteriaceae bacterium]